MRRSHTTLRLRDKNTIVHTVLVLYIGVTQERSCTVRKHKTYSSNCLSPRWHGSSNIWYCNCCCIYRLTKANIYIFSIRPRAPLLLFPVQRMWQGIKDHREGAGYFSDPISKPSIWKYWGTLGSFTFGSLLALEKQPTAEGLEAIKNSPGPDSGDGVTVTLSLNQNSNVSLLRGLGRQRNSSPL